MSKMSNISLCSTSCHLPLIIYCMLIDYIMSNTNAATFHLLNSCNLCLVITVTYALSLNLKFVPPSPSRARNLLKYKPLPPLVLYMYFIKFILGIYQRYTKFGFFLGHTRGVHIVSTRNHVCA